MPSSYDYGSSSGYGRARADWIAWPSTLTPIRQSDLDQFDQALFDLKGTVRNVRDYGAKGDASTDDYSAIMAAHTAASSGDVIYFPPPPGGAYKTNSELAFTKAVALRGSGMEGFTKIIAGSSFSGTNVVSLSPASLTKGVAVRRLYIDATNAPTASALYINNADTPNVESVKTRGGLNGFHIGNSQNGMYFRCYNANPVQYGLLGDNSSAATNKFIGHLVYQTSGATTDVTCGYEIQAGVDWHFLNPHTLRAPGIAHKMNYGFRVNLSVLANAQVWIVDGNFDGITTLVSDDSDCAAMAFINATTVRVLGGTWASAAPAADGTYNQPIRIDGSTDIEIESARLNGRGGVWFFNTCSDIEVRNSKSVQGGGGHFFNFGPATVTTLRQFGNRYATGDIADDATKITAALPTSGGGEINPPTILTSDASSKESLILKNASTGKTKRWRINNGATGTLELLADNGTTKIWTLSDGGQPVFPAGGIVTGKDNPSYSASITPNATHGQWFTITVTNGTAFTINAPSSAPASSQTQELTIEIFNNSGGAMGAITWDAAFSLVGGAFTNPASTKKRFVRFAWNGTTWIEITRASADYS